MFSRKAARTVRIQVERPSGRDLTFDGALMSTRPRGGVYTLLDATLVEADGRTHRIGTVRIPAARVMFWTDTTSLSSQDAAAIAAALEQGDDR